MREDNALLAVDLANPDLGTGASLIAGDTIHIYRSRFVADGACYERLRLDHHGAEPLRTTLSVHVHADFADIFEVRGAKRKARGEVFAPEVDGSTLRLRYQGKDGVMRTTEVESDPAPSALHPTELRYDIELDPKATAEIHIIVRCLVGDQRAAPRISDHDRALDDTRRALSDARARGCDIRTSNPQWNRWLERCASDLHMMLTDTPEGPYPYAGVPWFNTVFGRDGLITGLETLWVDPLVAKGVLKNLAATQADSVHEAVDAEPGKVVHEMRLGEMAQLGEVPFARYYGSVDATPLFVMLAHAYYARTGDRKTLEALWPSVKLALAWIDRHGDRDGDGFVEYARQHESGLLQQGWKDSNDSVCHGDGQLAVGPIALAEVQAYAYAAREAGAKIALTLGESACAVQLSHQASELKDRFLRHFWCDDLKTYGLALDGAKRLCRVKASNAGHCLYAGIASRDHAQRVTRTLMDATMFSGWGVRTLASSEARYNPMSYHNGSVWPHDNAIIGAGMARYGDKKPTLRILDALFQASVFLDLHRMPELLCGFPRRRGQGPTLYPVACAPQAWSAGAAFMLIQACLGMEVDGVAKEVRFRQPAMPEGLEWMEIKNLVFDDASVDLRLRRAQSDVAIEVLRKKGSASVSVTKSV